MQLVLANNPILRAKSMNDSTRTANEEVDLTRLVERGVVAQLVNKCFAELDCHDVRIHDGNSQDEHCTAPSGYRGKQYASHVHLKERAATLAKWDDTTSSEYGKALHRLKTLRQHAAKVELTHAFQDQQETSWWEVVKSDEHLLAAYYAMPIQDRDATVERLYRRGSKSTAQFLRTSPTSFNQLAVDLTAIINLQESGQLIHKAMPQKATVSQVMKDKAAHQVTTAKEKLVTVLNGLVLPSDKKCTSSTAKSPTSSHQEESYNILTGHLDNDQTEMVTFQVAGYSVAPAPAQVPNTQPAPSLTSHSIPPDVIQRALKAGYDGDFGTQLWTSAYDGKEEGEVYGYISAGIRIVPNRLLLPPRRLSIWSETAFGAGSEIRHRTRDQGGATRK